MADTLRSDHLDMYGYRRETAPVLGGMAAEGTLFRDNISQASWTKVSTPSIHTSLYPTTHTVKQVADRLPSSATTLAEAYRAAGYATLSFSSVGFTGQSSNMHQGFEELHEAGSRTADNQTKSAREYVDRLLPWLEQHQDVPFFVFLHVFDPHSPFEPRPPYDTLWADASKKAGFIEELDRVREFIETPTLRTRGMPSRDELLEAEVDPDEFISQYYDWYDGSIRGMDAEIGRLLEGLQALDLADSTLVAFIGDHGEEFLDHGRTWHGHSVYGELVNVPFLLWWPGVVPAGLTVDDTVRSIDLMPTLLALSGLAAPDGIQGQSLLPLMGGPAGGADVVEDWIVRPAGSERDLGDGRSVSLVADGWKLVRNTDLPDEDHPQFELFDHETDPLDLVNLANEHPDIVERLTKEIDRWQRQAVGTTAIRRGAGCDLVGRRTQASAQSRLRAIEPGRCCADPTWATRSPSSGPSQIDAVRRWPPKLGHPVQDVAGKDRLAPLPGRTARSKAVADDRLVPEEGILHAGLLMVARHLLPKTALVTSPGFRRRRQHIAAPDPESRPQTVDQRLSVARPV